MPPTHQQGQPSTQPAPGTVLIAVGQRLLDEDLAPFIHTKGMPMSGEIQRYKRMKLDSAVEMLKEKLLEVGEAYKRIFPYA